MADTKAIQLILDSIKELKKIPSPPDDYTLNVTETYVKRCAKILDSTKVTTTRITTYMQTVKDKLNELITILNDYCKMLQEAVAKALKRLKDKQSRRDNRAIILGTSDDRAITPANRLNTTDQPYIMGRGSGIRGSNGSLNKPQTKQDDIKQLQLLQNIAKQNGLLQEFIAQSNTCFDTNFTVSDIEKLEEHLEDWKRQTENTFKGEKEIEEMERKEEENRQKRANAEQPEKQPVTDLGEERLQRETEKKRIQEEEKKRKEEDEILKREAERKRKQEEEERLKREAELRRKQEEEEEERLKHEAEQKRIEEEEKRMKEKEEILKREAELKRKQEEEERLKHEAERRQMQEEEKQRKEEEQKMQREAERRRIQEEEEKKNKEELQRRQKEERHRQLMEEERQRRLDPMNWRFQVYPTEPDAVDDNKNHHGGVCCVVSAQDGGIESRDLNCSIAQDVDNSSDDITEDDERIASSMVTVDSVNGMVNLEAPVQVFLPHVDIDEERDEVVIKSSIDGGPWIEDTPTSPAKPIQGLDAKQMSRLAGKKLNSFKTAKLVAVSRPKLEKFTMGEIGGRIGLSSDETISITVPPGSFDRETVVRTQAVPVNDDIMDSMNKGSSSASSVIYVNCAQPPTKPLTVDITRLKDMENPSITSYTLVKEDNNQWKFADTNTCGQTTSVKLPMHRQRFCIIEVRLSQEEPCQIALDVAFAAHARTTYTPARLIIKQNQADPSSGIIQCVRSEEVDSTLEYLLSKGYGIGPNVSREVYIREGTHIEVTCTRNVLFVTDDLAMKKTICFYAHWGCTKEVSFGIKSKYFQRDYSCFGGDVISTFHGTCDTNNLSDGDLTITHTITLPKDGSTPKRAFGNMSPEMIALTNCVSFLLINDCSKHWQVILNNLCGGSKLRTVTREAERESGNLSLDSQHLCKLIISDWIKSKPVHFNKFAAVKYVFESSGYSTLVEPLLVYIDLFKEQMSDEVIKVLAAGITKDVSIVADNLQISDDEINEFFDEFHDDTRGQTEALIYGWRFTNTAIEAGANALDLLKRFLGL